MVVAVQTFRVDVTFDSEVDIADLLVCARLGPGRRPAQDRRLAGQQTGTGRYQPGAAALTTCGTPPCPTQSKRSAAPADLVRDLRQSGRVAGTRAG